MAGAETVNRGPDDRAPRAEGAPPPGTKRFQILLLMALSVPLIRSIHPEPVSFFLCMLAPGGREPAPGAPRGHPGPPPAPDGAGLLGRGWTPGLATCPLCRVGLGRRVRGQGEEAEGGRGSPALQPQQRPEKPGSSSPARPCTQPRDDACPPLSRLPCEDNLSLLLGWSRGKGCRPWMGASQSPKHNPRTLRVGGSPRVLVLEH